MASVCRLMRYKTIIHISLLFILLPSWVDAFKDYAMYLNTAVFKNLKCDGDLDLIIFSNLYRVCYECHIGRLIQNFTNKCRANCFVNTYFEACVKAYCNFNTETVNTYLKRAKRLSGSGIGFDDIE